MNLWWKCSELFLLWARAKAPWPLFYKGLFCSEAYTNWISGQQWEQGAHTFSDLSEICAVIPAASGPSRSDSAPKLILCNTLLKEWRWWQWWRLVLAFLLTFLQYQIFLLFSRGRLLLFFFFMIMKNKLIIFPYTKLLKIPVYIRP